MKKIFCFIQFALVTIFFGFAQNVIPAYEGYVDLTPLNPINNAPSKPGWSLVFQDEFNGSKNPMWKNEFCWGNSHPAAPWANKSTNYVQNPTSLIIQTKKEDYTTTWDGYNVNKHYTSAILNSDDCSGEIDPTPGRTFLYGYFEIRCRTPRSQLMWPAFWLYGEPLPGVSTWNELDIFEAGTGNSVVLTNHWLNSNGKGGQSKWLKCMPGQSFGGTWVTYALMWEPNKLVWYINNKPVYTLTDLTEVIPSVAMRIKINGAILTDPWYAIDYLFPKVLPNDMEIDYVRVYQRADHTLPNPIFTINGKTSFSPASPISVNLGTNVPITLDASQGYMPNHQYFVAVQECDIAGTPIGPEAFGWLVPPYNSSNLDLKVYAQDPYPDGNYSDGITLVAGKRYLVKVSGSPWSPVVQYMYTTNCSEFLDFTINGQPRPVPEAPIGISYFYGFPEIVVDASKSTFCSIAGYTLSIVSCNSSGTPTGTPTNLTTVTIENKNTPIDVSALCQQQNFSLNYSNYYKITLSKGYTSKSQVIFIQACNSTSVFSINNQTNAFPSAINIANGQDIILDGSTSTLCSGGFFVALQECNSSGVEVPGSTEIGGWVSNTSVANYNIRKLCDNNNFNLECSKYYRIKLATGPVWTESKKVIYILPCSTPYPDYKINGNSVAPVGGTDYWFNKEPGLFYNGLFIQATPNTISCDNHYFIAVQKRQGGVLVGPEAMAWLNAKQVHDFKLGCLDLRDFTIDPNQDGNTSDGFSLSGNSAYNIKLVASAGTCNSNTWIPKNTVIHFDLAPGIVPYDNHDEIENSTAIVQSDEITTLGPESDLENEIMIYPNPANEIININFMENKDSRTIKLMNIQGQVLQELKTEQLTEKINTSELSNGIYLIQIISSDISLTKRIQIVK